MSKKKRPVVIKQGLDGWVMTYGDMMSLLLTFFVLIVSFSSMQEAKFKDAALSLRQAFGVMVQPMSVIEFNDPLMPKYEMEESSDLLLEVRDLEMALLDQEAASDVEMEFTPEGMVFRLESRLLFAAGSSAMQAERVAALDELVTFFKKVSGEIRVEGHSDSIPIQNAQFPSNWELSAARAGAVARYFHGHGLSPGRIAATGYGEFRPLADNATAEGRAQNRRVEIWLRVAGKRPPGRRIPVSQVLNETGATAPRPTPVTDRLRTMQR